MGKNVSKISDLRQVQRLAIVAILRKKYSETKNVPEFSDLIKCCDNGSKYANLTPQKKDMIDCAVAFQSVIDKMNGVTNNLNVNDMDAQQYKTIQKNLTSLEKIFNNRDVRSMTSEIMNAMPDSYVLKDNEPNHDNYQYSYIAKDLSNLSVNDLNLSVNDLNSYVEYVYFTWKKDHLKEVPKEEEYDSGIEDDSEKSSSPIKLLQGNVWSPNALEQSGLKPLGSHYRVVPPIESQNNRKTPNAGKIL